MKIKISKLIKRDLIFGFENNKYKFIFTILVFMIIIWINAINLKYKAFELSILSKNVSFIDLFFMVFKSGSYDTSSIPVNWILINIFLTYLIGSYCYDDLSEDSSHMITRMKSRIDIWISKVIWMMITTLSFYLIILLIIAFFSISMFDLSFEWSNFSKFQILSIMHKNYSGIQFISITMCIYFLTSITMSILQMLISFVIKPKFIYIVNIFILMISLHSNKFIVPMQASLILRQNIFEIGSQFSPINSIIYNLFVFILIFILGLKYFKYMDILISQKTE